MRIEKFKCRPCSGRGDNCYQCGGSGELTREVWESFERQSHMSRIGTKQGPLNFKRRDPFKNRYVAKNRGRKTIDGQAHP